MPARILIVDDDPANREMLVLFLRTSGFSVVEAVDGVNAITVAKQHSPDLMILDFRLPAGDGAKVLERLRKDRNFASTPVIFISGNIQEARQALQASPAVRFVAKPLDLKALEALIRELLRPPAQQPPPNTAPPA